MKLSNIIAWLVKPKNLWITIFLYTIISGLFVQLILLPYIAPSWQSEYGHGLLKGVDGPKFNKIAFTLAKKIESEGWNQWHLAPNGQLVSGIAAIFYVLIYPEPWSVLPFNALLNATSCVCFYLLLSNLIDDRQTALISALPFMFFPSALLWNTQFHNENYVVPGVVFILFGWLLFTNDNTRLFGKYKAIIALMLIACGSILIGLVRNYILLGISYLFVFVSVVLSVFWLFEHLKIAKYLARITIVIVACTIMLFVGSSLDLHHSPNTHDSISDVETNVDDDQSSSTSSKWNPSTFLPKFIDRELSMLAGYRRAYSRPSKEGGSSLDMDVHFSNSLEMIAYIPRAIQIGLFSPFPNIWYAEAEKPAGRAMRMVTSVEELFSYFCLIGMPLFVWKRKTFSSVWIIFFICISMLIVYAMVIPNQGSLYRFRYPYYMPLVCFGFASWLEKLQKHIGSRTVEVDNEDNI